MKFHAILTLRNNGDALNYLIIEEIPLFLKKIKKEIKQAKKLSKKNRHFTSCMLSEYVFDYTVRHPENNTLNFKHENNEYVILDAIPKESLPCQIYVEITSDGNVYLKEVDNFFNNSTLALKDLVPVKS